MWSMCSAERLHSKATKMLLKMIRNASALTNVKMQKNKSKKMLALKHALCFCSKKGFKRQGMLFYQLMTFWQNPLDSCSASIFLGLNANWLQAVIIFTTMLQQNYCGCVFFPLGWWQQFCISPATAMALSLENFRVEKTNFSFFACDTPQ